MKVVVVGATGHVGEAVVKAFEDFGDEVIAASRNSSPSIDLTDPESITAFFEQVGQVDAVVATTGKVPFVSTNEATTQDFEEGFANKFQGQVNLVLHGKDYVRDGGSFTLSTGILNHFPVKDSVIASSVNGAIEAFAKAAATDIERGLRVNVVSASVIEEALEDYGPYFPGFIPVPAAKAAQFFVRAAHGVDNGATLTVFE